MSLTGSSSQLVWPFPPTHVCTFVACRGDTSAQVAGELGDGRVGTKSIPKLGSAIAMACAYRFPSSLCTTKWEACIRHTWSTLQIVVDYHLRQTKYSYTKGPSRMEPNNWSLLCESSHGELWRPIIWFFRGLQLRRSIQCQWEKTAQLQHYCLWTRSMIDRDIPLVEDIQTCHAPLPLLTYILASCTLQPGK